MSQEYFWGCELNKTRNVVEFDPDVDSDDANEAVMQHFLILKNAVLGTPKSAEDGEVHVVELETEGYLGTIIKQPILRLTTGSFEQCKLDIYIPRAGTLRLITGKGPVHICGQHLVEADDEIEEDDLDGEDEFEDSKELVTPENKKRKAAPVNSKIKPKKIAKMDASIACEMENSFEDDVESPEQLKPKQSKVKVKTDSATVNKKSKK